MAVISALKVWEVVPNSELKSVVVCLANTADAADTVDVTLSTYGISATGLLIVEGWKHTTDGSVIVEENPTTSVTAGVLTITIPGGTDDDFRVYRITGRGDIGAFA